VFSRSLRKHADARIDDSAVLGLSIDDTQAYACAHVMCA
jgi:hypothetical protein